MVGASGAVMAVVMLYTLYYPKREILLIFIPMPMWLLLAIYLIFPLLPVFNGGSTQIAIESHLAGAGFAFVFKQFDLRWSRLISGRAFAAEAPHLLAGPPRADAVPVAESLEDARRAWEGPASPAPFPCCPKSSSMRSSTRFLPRSPRRPRGLDRGGAPGAPGGQPPRPHPAERPPLSDHATYSFALP